MRHRLPAEVDLDRVATFARQLLVDVDANEAGAVMGDVLSLGFVRDRIGHTLATGDLQMLHDHIESLTTAVEENDLEAAATEAELLLVTLSGI